MAPLAAILNALRRAIQRDLGTFRSIQANNFFLFVALMIWGALNSGLEPKSAEPLLLLLGFLLLFPLSSDPLERIPAHRLALWPLNWIQRWALRMASLGFSPVIWIVLVLLWVKTRLAIAMSLLGVVVMVQFAVVLSNRVETRNQHWNLLRLIPQPSGCFGGLIRKNARELLSLLDVYVALLLSLGGSAYRFLSVHPDPAAFPILAILVALALSTYTQSLFGLELGSGVTRYRLLPLRGWEILLAKDLTFLAVLFVLVLPLHTPCGLAFGFASLAIGHHSSVLMHLPQQRWRFTGGRILPVGLVQILASTTVGMGELQRGPVMLLFTFIVYLGSLFWYGRCWDRRAGCFTLEP